MRISDWSSDLCSSDLARHRRPARGGRIGLEMPGRQQQGEIMVHRRLAGAGHPGEGAVEFGRIPPARVELRKAGEQTPGAVEIDRLLQRKEEHDAPKQRPEERRGGNECFSKCRCGWSPESYNKKTTKKE